MNLTSWKTVHSTIHSTFFGHAPAIRYFADLFGNRDGFADESELRLMRASESGSLSRTWLPGYLIIDNRTLPFRSVVSARVIGADNVVSEANVSETFAVDSSTQHELPGSRHNVTLGLRYDDSTQRSRATVRLPLGSTGTATSSGNVMITAIGPVAWSIAPGASPSPLSSLAFVYINALSPAIPGASSQGTDLSLLAWFLAALAAIPVVIGAVWWIRRRQRAKPPPGLPSERPKEDTP
jgi:hypothetical protein